MPLKPVKDKKGWKNMSNQTDTCKHLEQKKYICEDQESNPGQLLNKQQYTPLYHHHCGEKKESQLHSHHFPSLKKWKSYGEEEGYILTCF